MINLLPSALKQEYQYARRNTTLVHWLIALGFGFIGLIAISTIGVFYLQQTANSYEAQATAGDESLKKSDQVAVEKQVLDISNSLKLAVQVLSQEVLFSKMLKQLAVITPSNATLSNLNISQLQGGVDITAKTTDYNAATQLQVNLTDPANQIFAKADIVSIVCTSTPASGQAPVRYPCTVVIRALFANNNPFLFINSEGSN